MAIAYQANIPIIALRGFGGWADEMAGKYFDPRRRLMVIVANTPTEAVDLAFESIKNSA